MPTRHLKAVILDGRHLEQSEEICAPVGAQLEIAVEDWTAENDYASRLRRYYANCPAEAVEEERRLAASLTASDTALPEETPWW